ncbi:MAG: CocE/NonD family hydrolase [Pikeienuella sp.]
MKELEKGPFAVQETPNIWIRLPDGRCLAARMWRPVTDEAVPAILEYLPYRKRDGTAERDALTHPWLAAQGYACLRVDIAGTGESDGLFDDEYSEQELSDGEAVIAWIAAQKWCSGAVGMIGISWGGFNGLQLAARQPDALKAVVSICSTADRYADDIHYKGGCMLGENMGWAATVLGWFGLPPDPVLVGDRWRDMWIKRLEATPHLASTWLRHQSRDAYWRHGSVCEDYSAITAAVLTVGGWHDGYRNTINHLVSNLSAPSKGIVGPWNHKYPHFGRPGPTIHFLGEISRWFDRWLKGEDNGAEADPDYRAYLMDGIAPDVDYDYRPGRWVAEAKWPSPNITPLTLHCAPGRLGDAPAPFATQIETNVHCGLGAGEYFPFGFGPGELPDDQRHDDALSAVFDSEINDAPLDILGAPVVRLSLSSDQPRAQIAVRLCDVAPDGASALISHGVLNLRHRGGHEVAVDLTPGEMVDVSVTLDQCAYRLPPGHRLRLAVSPSYWPYIWPEAEPVTLTVLAGEVDVPKRPTATKAEWVFAPPQMAPALPIIEHGEVRETKHVETDTETGEQRLIIESDDGGREDPTTGLIMGIRLREVWTIREGDPASARSYFEWERTMRRGGWSVRTVAKLSQWADREAFHISGSLEAFEGDEPVVTGEFADSVARL